MTAWNSRSFSITGTESDAKTASRQSHLNIIQGAGRPVGCWQKLKLKLNQAMKTLTNNNESARFDHNRVTLEARVTARERSERTEGLARKAIGAFFATANNSAPLIARVTLGAIMLPHGLQKTLGWFGGHGFAGTMGFFESLGIPAALGFLAIAAESAGALALIAGLTSRLAAFGIAGVMGVAVTMHKANGFFMNWYGNQKGEGFEYHLLAIGLALVVMIHGAGKASIDRYIARRLEA